MFDALTTLYRGHSLAVAFASFAFGIEAAVHRAIASSVAFAIIAMFVVIFRTRPKSALRALAILIVLAFAAGTASTALALRRESERPYGALAERHVVAKVAIVERPRTTSSGESARARIVEVGAPSGGPAAALRGERALLEFPEVRDADAIVGRIVSVRARLSVPAGSRNDGEPPQRDILAEQGVSVILSVPRAAVLRAGPLAVGADTWWARLRVRCARAVESRLPPLEATVLEGILWGDRGNLPATLRQEFSDTGTVHVLTTAGLHLGIFAAIVAWLLSNMAVPRRLRVALIIASAWGYAGLAGMHLPTVRAASMLTAGLFAVESGRGRSPSAVLAAAAFAVIVPHPLVLLTPSFAMSFSCVGGIALLSPALRAVGFREGGGVPNILVEYARTSIAVQVAMWPLQALYFNAFTPYAVIANMIVVPLVGVVMALGAALVCASQWLPPIAVPIGNLAWWGVAGLTGSVEKFAALPNAHVDVPPPTHVFILLYWISLAAFAFAVREPARIRAMTRLAAPAVAALAVAYCAPGLGALFDRDLHVDAIDVGQADCILIRAPGMHSMLVDGGGKLERSGARGTVVAQPIGDVVASRTVMPFLLRHWVTHLDAVVLTHPHGDHAGGLPVILERERVGVLYDSAQLYGGPAYQRALEVVRERHVRYRVARRGKPFDLGAATHVKILGPELPLITGTSSDINNNSVVLRMDFGKVAVLLTGDAQSEAEARLLSHGGTDLRADILKVGHHGSAYSSTAAFLAAVHPKIAIISCGLHNVFGHPSPRTLAALLAAGAQIFRTDVDGGISIETDGESIGARTSGAEAMP